MSTNGRETRDEVPAGDPAELIAAARFGLQAARGTFDNLQNLADAWRMVTRDRPLTADETRAMNDVLAQIDKLRQKRDQLSAAIRPLVGYRGTPAPAPDDPTSDGDRSLPNHLLLYR
jgi:hypothetical protein